ncbi:PIN domain-like protein [Microthyrium microscopicum]|uniref:PIN domain-like protein n=1 Tax=Microthyrium microscopicum TaxID=703497 RepID=A0A6A6U492_9PEZI|nr:PIN domain-like protein [Microthyrium microscopicum]
MGISGLLPLLKSIQKPTHLRKFAGQTIGIDAYGWLHRGTTACAVQLALGQHTTKYVEFAMNRVRMLLHFGIIPYIVFDGDYLPSKACTEKDRLKRREESKKLGLELLRLGKTAQAQQELQKAVDVTPEMAGLLIRELKRANIKYVVAPYEADSQLAYLERHGHIQGIISEDSDLLVFGARCLLTKLDQYGECVMIRRDDFTACREVSLVGWTDQDFRRMAILSGCDYLDNIDQLGLKTAHRLLRKHKTIERVLQAVRLEGKLKVPQEYLIDFVQAENTFLYQWVFCPSQKAMVNLSSPGQHVDIASMEFLGRFVEPAIAAGVAGGDLNPHTKKPLILQSEIITTPKYGFTRKENQVENLDTKKNMTLDAFFKSRQPLAELDPNSFILTPRQEEQARRASNSSWQPQTAPILLQSEIPVSNSITHVRRNEVSVSTTPATNPSKRQKLSNGVETTIIPHSSTIAEVMTGSSRFFAKSEKKKRKRRSTDFTVFSDDSVDEAMLSLPLNHLPNVEVPVKSKATCEPNELVVGDESQITLVEASPTETLRNDFEDIDDTLVDLGLSKDKSPAGCFDKYLLSDVKVMRKKSLEKYTNTSQLNNPGICGNQHDSLPLQPDDELDISDMTWAEASQVIVVPASDPIEHPPISHALGLQGSEDLIVSESEDEEFDGKTRKPALDLRRFAFTAT